MTKLQQLLNDLCPDGVEYKKIKDVYTRLRGTPITATKMKEIENPKGDIKIFAGGKTVINAYEKDIPNANITKVPAVLVQSRGVIDAIYFDKPFTFKNEMWAYTADNKISIKFLYYVLKNNMAYFREKASGMGSLPQISLTVTEDFAIPVPPLEVQAEIVRILDTFTELQTKLEEELTARQKQYEYYRDSLLNFNHKIGGVQWVKLEDIAIYKTGSKPSEILDIYENGMFEYINAGTSNSGYTYNFNCLGDTITTPSRGQGGIGYVGYQANNFWLGALCYKIQAKDKNIILNKYLYYYLSNNNNEILMLKKEGGVPAVNGSDLGKIQIPVPPLDVQQRIVDVLDNFEKICTDLKIGLPAEINARQKQYEYYRDKLLTFERKN